MTSYYQSAGGNRTISENAALPTPRTTNPLHSSEENATNTTTPSSYAPPPRRPHHNNHLPRKPLNQIERPIVFSHSKEVQTIRDTLISLHDDHSYEAILSSTRSILNLGDISLFDSEISDVFVKALSTLSVEIPILVTFLSLLYQKNSSFLSILFTKLTASLLESLSSNSVKGIFSAKMQLRSLVCFAVTGIISVEEMIQILEIFLSSSSSFMAYLLLTTIPYLLPKLSSIFSSTEVQSFLSKVEVFTERVCSQWSSEFNLHGKRAIFQVTNMYTSTSIRYYSLQWIYLAGYFRVWRRRTRRSSGVGQSLGRGQLSQETS